MADAGRSRRTTGGATAPGPDPAPAAGPVPRASSPTRTRPGRRASTRALAPSPASALAAAIVPALFLLLGLAPTTPARAQAQGQGVSVIKLPDAKIAEIRFEGNATISSDKIKRKLLSKVGQPFDQDKINADVQTLNRTNWFSHAEAYHDESPPGSGRHVLIFAVREMPTLRSVEFRGMKALRLKDVEDNTGLKKGSRADHIRTRNAITSIYRLYQEKGYDLAEVELLEGGNPGDTKVVIQIFEGPKMKIGSISFEGCQFASSAVLRTHIASRKPILGLFGQYHRELLDEDRQKLMDYYQGHGFFDARVTPVTRPGKNPGEIDLTFVIYEGVQYHVRKVILQGNSKLKTPALMEDLELHSGRPYQVVVRDADKNRILIKYNEIGCIDTEVDVDPRFTSEPGIVDLLYTIREGEPFLLGALDIEGNTRTKDWVIRREAMAAGLNPGEVLDKNRIELFKRRLTMLGYFQNDPQKPDQQIRVEIRPNSKRPPSEPYGNIMLPLGGGGGVTQARMQDPSGDGGPDGGLNVPQVSPLPGVRPGAGAGAGAGGAGMGGLPGLAEPNDFSPPANSAPGDALPPMNVPPPIEGGPPPVGAPGGFIQPGVAPPSQPPVGAGEPPGADPSIPGMGMTSVGPDRNDPFPNRSFADVVASVEEAPTGRLMFSVGANSFQGLMGGISFMERNFDLFKPPTSWSDIVNQRAFRGAGQELRVNIQAGTLINFMQVSLRDPYFLGLPLGAGVSGYLFQRIYPNWFERRGGGRINVGRQIGTMTYFDVSAWAEEVDFYGYQTPAPADYLAASGYTQLYAIQPTLRIDNRNNPVMPTKGQYAQFTVEQGFGSFTFTKFDAEGRLFVPTYARPDGTGKQFFTFRGHFGIATDSTPVYERYFAGNFGNLRGFYYRTVSPHAFGVPTGGIMMALGSVEYQFPWNARDSLNQIIFCDFGTVTGNYEFSNLRVSIGTGLKVILPMFGPMPFEFDLAFPVEYSYGDRFMPFNFSSSVMY